MLRYIYIILVIIFVLPALTSCRAISSFFKSGEVVAKVGQEKLYRSDIDNVIPNGIPYEDSVRLTKQYINSWASDRVFLSIAESQLSKSEKDVTSELEDYRKSLLKYRYEQLYVNERLDTAVTDEQIEDYYLDNEGKFILERPIVKARFVNIASDSPSLMLIKMKMSSTSVDDLVEADSLAFSSAIKFTTWSDRWIDISEIAREYVVDYTELLKMQKKGWIEKLDTLGQVRLTYISDMVSEGKVAPLDFCRENIRDIIISARKQKLIMNLEQDLLNEARENGQFKIY